MGKTYGILAAKGIKAPRGGRSVTPQAGLWNLKLLLFFAELVARFAPQPFHLVF
jgi:hypothetical protein